jgi:RNA polymerase sigma-70 factor (ECF subfamily)
MDQSQAELLLLMQTDLAANYGYLVAAYQHRLFAFMFRQTGSFQDAEDIVQEAFLHAYFALGNYPAQRIQALKVLPWLFRIALNIFYSDKRVVTVPSVPLDFTIDGPHLEMADTQEPPDVAMEKWEDLQELQAFLMKLPAPHREAINLYYFEGLRYQEIADLLDVPIGTVKSNLSRGIRLLRKTLADEKKEVR